MSVLLPSSTEPAVAKRSRSAGRSVRRRKTSSPSEMRAASSAGVCGATLPLSPLTILHRRLGHAVVAARLPALGHFGGGDLRDDLAERARRRFDRARAAHVA